MTPTTVIAGAVLAWSLMTSPACGETPAAATVGAVPFNEDVFPSTETAFPGGVKALPDLIFHRPRNYRALRMDLYLPPARFAAPRPFVVYTHGGGWAGGSTRTTGAFTNWPGVLAALAARGYVVASVDYRLLGDEIAPAAIQDAKAAIKFLRANAKKYNIDKDRGLTWGASAGGQIAALAGTSCGAPGLSPPVGMAGSADAESDCVQGAIGWYSTYDMTPMNGGYGPYLGCTNGSPCAAAKQQSAITYLSPETPPFLIVQGVGDTVVPFAQAQNFFDAMQAKGLQARLLLLPGVGHSFIGATPEATKTASLQALAATFEFIDVTLGRGAARDASR